MLPTGGVVAGGMGWAAGKPSVPAVGVVGGDVRAGTEVAVLWAGDAAGVGGFEGLVEGGGWGVAWASSVLLPDPPDSFDPISPGITGDRTVARSPAGGIASIAVRP